MKVDQYITKNLNIAAFLYASGLQLVSTTQIGRDFFFSFTPKDKAQKLVDDYFSGQALVNARDLFARLHDLKDLIFAGGRNE